VAEGAEPAQRGAKYYAQKYGSVVLAKAQELALTPRGRLILLGCFLLLGVAFIGYSLLLKEWCGLAQTGWGQGHFGQTGFGGQLGECLKQKGWFEL
jgi:hypothetical protein